MMVMPAPMRKRVAVVGSGPGGVACAFSDAEVRAVEVALWLAGDSDRALLVGVVEQEEVLPS